MTHQEIERQLAIQRLLNRRALLDRLDQEHRRALAEAARKLGR